MSHQYASINVSNPSGRPRTVRTNENIREMKNPLRCKGRVSARKLSVELDISERRVLRILKVDLGVGPYQKIIDLALSDDQKTKRKQFANWVRTNFQREKTENSLLRREII